MGTRGWEGEAASTDSCGTATAALPCFGQGRSDLPASVVVVVAAVVVVVDDGAVVVVVDPGVVVVVEGPVLVVAEVATSGAESTMGAPTRATTAMVTAEPRRNN
jgi:hypothetical protein